MNHFKAINPTLFKTCVDQCNHYVVSVAPSEYRLKRRLFDNQRTALVDLAAAQKKRFHHSLLAIDATSVPAGYVHEPVSLADASMEQIELQCAVPPLVQRAHAIWRAEAKNFEPDVVERKPLVSITHRLGLEFPFDQEQVVRRLANGDPVTEQFHRNRFAAARLLGTRMHCYIELHARGIAIPEPLVDGAFQQFLDFWRDCIESNGLVPWRVEHTVHGSACYGTVDALFARQCELEQASEPLNLFLFDWKRCSRSLMSSPAAKQERHVRQLELQRAAIHEHHNGSVQVVGMFLCRFYSNESSYELVQVK